MSISFEPASERFKELVEKGDAEALRRALEHEPALRAVINEPLFGFDAPALNSVAGHNNIPMIDALLAFGADPNRKSSWWAGGFHPLHIATGATADRLINGGSIPDACGAANLDRIDLLTRILVDDPSRAHERGGDGQTPLHFARSRAAVDLLLDAGAGIDARDVDHRSSAAEWMLGEDHMRKRSRLDVAKYLVERGASTDIFLAAALGLTERARAMVAANPALLALRTGQGDYGEKPPSSLHIYLWTIGSNTTPLEAAARFGHKDTVDAMRAFATPEQRLILACQAADRETALAIVREQPGIVERLGPADARALTDAAWAPNAPAVELMLELGFDPAAPSVSGPTGGTALHCAAWEGSVACVAALLRYPSGRALINAREATYQGTPLSWCCHGSSNCGNPKADHAEVARLLIAGGAVVGPQLQGCSESMQRVIEAARRDAT